MPKCNNLLLKPFFLIVMCLLLLYSCNKGSSNNPAPDNSAAIIGKWLLTKQTIRIYSESGALVRDSTDAFGVIKAGVNTYWTFKQDGSEANLVNADTTAIYYYTVTDKALNLYPNVNHSSYNVYNIVSLDETNMDLESIMITDQLSNIWRLDPTVTYKVYADNFYTRE